MSVINAAKSLLHYSLGLGVKGACNFLIELPRNLVALEAWRISSANTSQQSITDLPLMMQAKF